MPPASRQLRDDALQIWRAGVDAVLPERLIREHVRSADGWLLVGDERIDLRDVDRIAVVGAGKAAGGMAVALEQALGPERLARFRVEGWVNVPADCVVPTSHIHLHAGRPAGKNEPHPEGVEGTRQILRLVRSLGPRDLCLALVTGGGSALLVAPVPGISLENKLAVTQRLSAAGADIEALNTVRRALSEVKGGGLARACGAGRLITLIISDVLGDPPDAIASGPTIDATTTADDALVVLESFHLTSDLSVRPVVEYLRAQRSTEPTAASAVGDRPRRQAIHQILANNATAVDAAGAEAERLGYAHAMISADRSEGPAEEVGHHLAAMAMRMRDQPGPDCLISGGEPTVELVDAARRGKGGRNQQLALAALTELGDCHDLCLLSGGTDGEDGPTDAAGAWIDAEVAQAAREQQLAPADFLARNDAYHFFASTGGLLKTGPTHTNVCDLRVITVRQTSQADSARCSD